MHLRLWLSKAFRTSRACPENTTNGTRSKSTERTLKVVSDIFMFWSLMCVGVKDLTGSDVPTI